MRKEYKKPGLKIERFDSEDIMTESGNPQDPQSLKKATVYGGSQSWNSDWEADLVE